MKRLRLATYSLQAFALLTATVVFSACKTGAGLDEDAGSTDSADTPTTTSGGTIKDPASLVSSNVGLRWPGVEEESRASGFTQRAAGADSGGVSILPIYQSNGSPSNWNYCFENNTPEASRCQWASSDIQATIGLRPVAIQAFQLNVYTSGSHYKGTITNPSLGDDLSQPIQTGVTWTVSLDAAWIKTAKLGFDSGSGALRLTSPHTEVLAGSGESSCALSDQNAVGYDTGNTKVLTGIYFMDEADPDPTGGNGGTPVINNYYAGGRLKAGKVWYAGLYPDPLTDDPFRLKFLPETYGDSEGMAVFGMTQFSTSGAGVLPKFEDSSSDKAMRVITGVCIQGRKVSGSYSRPLFLHSLLRFNKPEMRKIK